MITAAGEAGFLGITVPEEFGGGGTADVGFLAVLVEETIAAGATGLALIFALHAGVVIPFLINHGTDADRARWAPGLASGELVGLPAGRGSIAADPAVLTGVVPGVPGGRLADLLLLPHGDPEPKAVLLAVDSYGVTVEPVLGSLAASDAAIADVVCTGARLSDGAVVGPEGAATAQRDLDLWFGVLALAAARAAMALTIDYVSTRKVFGRSLAEFQNTRFRLAELSADLKSITALADACLRSRSLGTLDADDAAALRLRGEALNHQAADQGLQLHGGYGYMREYPISLAFADARFLGLAAQAHSDPRRTIAAGIGL